MKNILKYGIGLFLFLLVGTTGCEKENEETEPEKYEVIELNMADAQFTDLPTIGILMNAADGKLVVRKTGEIDSIFISYAGMLLYPTRLPQDFPIYENPMFFSGEIKQQQPGMEYTPIVLTEFKYEYMIEYI